MLLPARMAVLNYLSSVENADVNEIMEAMRPLYGKERQFTKDAYLDHVMSLEANGLCSLIRYELDDKDELSSGSPSTTMAAPRWKNTFPQNTATSKTGGTLHEILR